MTAYIDASAAAKLLVQEPESETLASYLDGLQNPAEGPVSSALLETELRRVAVRLELSQAAVSEVLGRVTLIEPSRSLFYEAGLLPGDGLRSLDALHLATALRLDDAVLVAYDAQLLRSAVELGMEVASPTL